MKNILFVIMKDEKKIKRKRIAYQVPLTNDTKTLLLKQEVSASVNVTEAYLFKQAKNPLGDPHKV
ncbi:MAG: hypothetical protein ABIQ31_19685 [Ferruginibacter sp.]